MTNTQTKEHLLGFLKSNFPNAFYRNKREVNVTQRQSIAYFLKTNRKILNIYLTDIANILNYKSHSTVLHSCNIVQNWHSIKIGYEKQLDNYNFTKNIMQKFLKENDFNLITYEHQTSP